jgi:hypothetical protein
MSEPSEALPPEIEIPFVEKTADTTPLLPLEQLPSITLPNENLPLFEPVKPQE